MARGFVRALKHLRDADKKLARLIEQVGPCRLEVDPLESPFEALVSAIVYQQLTGKAAATILARLIAAFPRRGLHPDDILAAPLESLRAAGLSGAKAAAIRDLAGKAQAGVVPSYEALRLMNDESIVERLTTVRGIGRWTVDMLLIFRLGRTDVLPVGDYGVRKGFALTFHPRARRTELPALEQLVARAERWRPYRSVASWYLWRALDVAAGTWRR